MLAGDSSSLRADSDSELELHFANFDWSVSYDGILSNPQVKLGADTSEVQARMLDLCRRYLAPKSPSYCGWWIQTNVNEEVRKDYFSSPVVSMKTYAANILRPHLSTAKERPDWRIEVFVDLDSGVQKYRTDPKMPDIAHHAARLLLEIVRYQQEPLGGFKLFLAMRLGRLYERLRVRQSEPLARGAKNSQEGSVNIAKIRSQKAKAKRAHLQDLVNAEVRMQIEAGESANYSDAVRSVAVEEEISEGTVKKHTKNQAESWFKIR